MANLTRYILVDAADRESDFEYESYEEALADASALGAAIVERTYAFHDSELVWTPDGGDVWPPQVEADAI